MYNIPYQKSDDRECKPSMYTKCYYHVVIYFTLESTPYTVPQQAVIVTHDTHCVVLYNLYKDGVYLHHLRKRHVFRILNQKYLKLVFIGLMLINNARAEIFNPCVTFYNLYG